MRPTLFALGPLLATCALPALAARELTTDRPDTTESPYTVEPGRLQIEASLVEFAQDNHNPDHAPVRTGALNIAPFNLRIGLTPDSDLHIVVETYRQERTLDRSTGQQAKANGTGDITLRYKYNFFGNDGGGPALGILPFIKLPTARSGLGNRSFEGGVILPVSLELGAGWGLAAMTEVDVVRNAADSGYEYVWVNSASFDHKLVGDLSSFLELVSEVGPGRPALSFNAGLTYGIGEDLQLDAGTNLGITRPAEDLRLFVGITKRF